MTGARPILRPSRFGPALARRALARCRWALIAIRARLERHVDGLVQRFQRGVELLLALVCEVGFALMQQAVGEGVFPGGVRGVGLFGVVGAADDAVLMITQQCLMVLAASDTFLAPATAAV